MRNLFQRLVVFLSAFAASFFALTPTVFATGIPYTGDDNKVGLVIGLLVVSVIVIVLRSMDALKVYEVIQLMTAGGPGSSSETLNIYISKVGFSWFEMGYAAALGIFTLYFIMFVAKIIISKTGVFQSEVSKA